MDAGVRKEPSRARRGAVYGLVAAALFGISPPLAKGLLGSLSPQMLAGLLYLGAGGALQLWLWIRPATPEAPIERSDWPWLAGVIVSGGVLGPLLLLIGLQRVSGVAGSLLLNLEGLFTIGLAIFVFREHVGRLGWVAALAILSGAVVLNLDRGPLRVDGWGAFAVALACLCWALDNNLTQRLSLRDPAALVRTKALCAGAFNFALGVFGQAQLPSGPVIAGALLLGAASYGVSVVLDAHALRLVGAAREALFFATAPFIGALAAVPVLGEALRPVDGAAMALMVLGVAALLRERHSHVHTHEALEHDHLHVHDEHHQHAHPPGMESQQPHAHPHRHAPLVHNHPHLPDAHHRHRHP